MRARWVWLLPTRRNFLVQRSSSSATFNSYRLDQARTFGCETINVSEGNPEDQIEDLLGVPEVDCSIDAVGFEAHGHGANAGEEAPATVLNSLMGLTRAGGALGIPGLYVTEDPGGVNNTTKVGALWLDSVSAGQSLIHLRPASALSCDTTMG